MMTYIRIVIRKVTFPHTLIPTMRRSFVIEDRQNMLVTCHRVCQRRTQHTLPLDLLRRDDGIDRGLVGMMLEILAAVAFAAGESEGKQ